jgi:hypothetical protein
MKDKPKEPEPEQIDIAIEAARDAGQSAYEAGADRVPPREFHGPERFDEMNAWLDGWDSMQTGAAFANT